MKRWPDLLILVNCFKRCVAHVPLPSTHTHHPSLIRIHTYTHHHTHTHLYHLTHTLPPRHNSPPTHTHHVHHLTHISPTYAHRPKQIQRSRSSSKNTSLCSKNMSSLFLNVLRKLLMRYPLGSDGYVRLQEPLYKRSSQKQRWRPLMLSLEDSFF